MKEPVVLLFCAGEKTGGPWRAAASRCGIPCRDVPPAACGRTIRELLEGKAPAASAGPRMGLPETMVVMAGLTRERMDAYLSAARAAGAERGILKAVVTPVNLFWTPEKLYGELAKERQAFSERAAAE